MLDTLLLAGYVRHTVAVSAFNHVDKVWPPPSAVQIEWQEQPFEHGSCWFLVLADVIVAGKFKMAYNCDVIGEPGQFVLKSYIDNRYEVHHSPNVCANCLGYRPKFGRTFRFIGLLMLSG